MSGRHLGIAAVQHSLLPAVAEPVFQPQVAPEAAIPHPAWQRARAAALEALFSGDATILLGQAGSGKTLLLTDLARVLRNADQPVRLIKQPTALQGARGEDILLVDEADALDADVLEALCAGPAPVLLAVRPGSMERLARLPVRCVALDPLAPEDVARFVAARLAAAGRPRDLLEAEAVLALARHSGGLPRLVNTIGGSALFLAGWDGSPRVKVRHVEEAAAMRNDPGDGALPPRAAPFFASRAAPSTAAMLPNYSAALMRRRVALGGMTAVAGVLFALPWLTHRRVSGPLPAAQADTGHEDAGHRDAASREADSREATPRDVSHQGAARQAVQAAQGDAGGPSQADKEADGLTAAGVADARSELAADGTPDLDARLAPASSVVMATPGGAGGERLTAPGRPAAVAPDRPAGVASDTSVVFQGSIFNETMGQSGHVSLVIRRQPATDAITARFNASQGLVGSGVLAGSVSGTGRITASGQLLMGKNPFLCDLNGVLNGNTLTGSASFVRSGTGATYHSRFTLVRA